VSLTCASLSSLTITAITAGLTFATMSANPGCFAPLAALISAATTQWGRGPKQAQATSNANVANLEPRATRQKLERIRLDMGVVENMCVSPQRGYR
jgi:hypothetical protein